MPNISKIQTADLMFPVNNADVCESCVSPSKDLTGVNSHVHMSLSVHQVPYVVTQSLLLLKAF